MWTLGSLGAVLLVFSLCFSLAAYRWGLDRVGLSMSIVALGTCMLIAASTQSGWRSPRLLTPLRLLGKRSYEVYLTHMFVILSLFGLFVDAGKPLLAVPELFLGVIVCAGLLGELLARFYSEPINRRLRNRWGDGPDKLGSLVEPRP